MCVYGNLSIIQENKENEEKYLSKERLMKKIWKIQ